MAKKKQPTTPKKQLDFKPIELKGEFVEEDFDRMEFNPFVTNGQLIDHYPKLRRRRAFRAIHNFIDCDLLLRFVILYLDPQSPFFDISELIPRQQGIIKLLNIPAKSRTVQEITLERKKDDKHEPGLILDNFIYEYFRMVNNHKYELWFTLKMDYHKSCEFLRSSPPDDAAKAANDAVRRTVVAEKLPEKMKSLLKLEDELFRDPRTRRVVEAYSTQDDDLAGYAEAFAEANEFFSPADIQDQYE